MSVAHRGQYFPSLRWATVSKHSGARYHLCPRSCHAWTTPADNDGETFQLLGLSHIYSLQTETRPPRRSSLDISRLQIHLVEMYSVNLSWIIQVRQESKNGGNAQSHTIPNLLCIRLCPTTIQSILGWQTLYLHVISSPKLGSVLRFGSATESLRQCSLWFQVYIMFHVCFTSVYISPYT